MAYRRDCRFNDKALNALPTTPAVPDFSVDHVSNEHPRVTKRWIAENDFSDTDTAVENEGLSKQI